MRHLLLAGAVTAVLVSPAMGQDTISEFRIGMLGGESRDDQLADHQCLADYLETALGVPVELFPSADYDGVVQGFLGGTLDFAIMGGSSYAKIYLQDPEAAEPVLTFQQIDGSLGYHSVIVARADSGIATLDDLEGRSLAFADPDSTSGYLIPVTEFNLMDLNPETYFSETQFGGGHENAVLGVLEGKWDAAATWVSGAGDWEDGYSRGNLHSMVEKGILDMDDLVQVWMSREIPGDPVVIRSSLPDDVKQTVVGLMTGLKESDPECLYAVSDGEVQAMVPVDHSFWEIIVEARRQSIGG